MKFRWPIHTEKLLAGTNKVNVKFSFQNIWIIISCWMLNISQTASYEITLACLLSVRPFICLSLHPSLSFSKLDLFFPDIVHEYRWPWNLGTDKTRFLKKQNLAAQICTKWGKLGPKLSFVPFSQVWSISFPWNGIQW